MAIGTQAMRIEICGNVDIHHFMAIGTQAMRIEICVDVGFLL
jgi:hypothetical protein